MPNFYSPTNQWFTTPVIGAYPAEHIARATGEPLNISRIDDEYGAVEIKSPFPFTPKGPQAKGARPSAEDVPTFEGSGRKSPWWLSSPPLWVHTNHVFGFLPPGRPPHIIVPLSAIRPNPRLRNARITITLDRLRVAEYPGRNGTHKILVHVYAQNQAIDQVEDLHFNSTYRVRSGEEAALRGYPLFVGLSVENVGIRLRCRTINVSNSNDEAFLSILESDAVKSGLQLATVAQPAIAPFSRIAFDLAKAIGTRHRNVPVQDIDLCLDFSTSPMGARLAEGAYIAAQVPGEALASWNWSNWIYNPSNGLIQYRHHARPLAYNYLVFSIQRYRGDER